MSALISGALAIFVSMFAKLIGYEFIVRVTVIGLRSWAESTATHRDDEVVEAMAAAWGVAKKEILKLGA